MESTLPSAVIDSVRKATESTFAMILGDELAYEGDGDDGQTGGAVVGVIPFVGDFAWSLVVALPEQTAPRIAEKMAGFEIAYDSADMADVVGELANIVAGDGSARLDASGIQAQLGLPTVACGSDLRLLFPGGAPCVSLQFSSPDGGFVVKAAGGKHP